jgi:hypothetical protein
MVRPLPNVLWIGGPPRSGKSTIARRLARRHGLRWYNADAHTWEHRDRALAAGSEAARRWEAMTPEERWVRSTPAEQLELSLHVERGPMVVDDVRGLPRSPLTVAEGTTVPAAVVSSGIAARERAVWLIPTADLQRARLGEGGRSPAELFVLLAETIEQEAREHGAPIVDADGSRDVEEMVAAVEGMFAAALAEGPCATSASERLALLRYANDAVVSQCLAYLARPWTTGDAESFVRTFVCECDDPECDAPVELSIAAFERAAEAGPVIAGDHD